jgi:hypothetical protein
VFRVTKSSVRRVKRTDDTLHLVQKYSGNLGTPATYNQAMASALHAMADKIATVKNAYVDPEVVVWMHVDGRIQAEATLSPLK